MSDASNDPSSMDSGIETGIAIIGMAGRFPGAETLDQFWRNLCGGVESITHFKTDELEDSFSDEVRSAPNFVKARPILPNADRFDAAFFGMHRREAELTDPQHRVFLECAWEALEDGGCDPSRYTGAIGVFAGSSMNTYFLNNVCGERKTIDEFTSNYQVGCYPMLVGSSQDFLATRVSYKLDLKGPSLTLQTACSTSLVAVTQACQSLQLYQSDMALAGGVSITFPQKRGYLHQEGGMVSADGSCRTFDADASGTIFGSGAGVVLLKRLADAVADGDNIYAVIRGCGINNDGAAKAGYTAPSADGQAAAIEMALAAAGVDARSISYVECHGTATPLGDPIEVSGLTKAFRASTNERAFCALGSVKTNIGHLDVAAGVAGLIKTALALKHRQLPPSLHYQRANPQIDFTTTPFYVNTALTDWYESDTPLRAGVSAFGVGGTNAHVILERAPMRMPEAARAVTAHSIPPLLVLSARSAVALDVMRVNLADHITQHPEQALSDICGTLQQRRRSFRHRCATLARTHQEAADKLVHAEASQRLQGIAPELKPALSFMFPGQGVQYPQMGRALYDSEPVFARHIEHCAEVLQPLLGLDLRMLLYQHDQDSRAAAQLQATAVAQPAIFAVEYALAQLWISWGVKPQFMIGHSVGEFVAATLAGVFSLDDALQLVATRGALMQALPSGSMLAVRLPEQQLLPLLGPELSIAAVNAPSMCVVAGPTDAIDALAQQLETSGTACRRLHTSHAFHSSMVDPIIEPLRAVVQKVPLHAPQLPYISCVTGQWITPEQATSADYWARHAREPVRFADGIATLTETRSQLLLEVGPGRTLTTFAHQASTKKIVAIVSLPDASLEPADGDCMAQALGRLWNEGIDIDWPTLNRAPHQGLSLPTYPFERNSYWIAQPPRVHDQPQPPLAVTPPHPISLTPPSPSLQDSTAMNDAAMLQIPSLATPVVDGRLQQGRSTVIELLEELSGESLADAADTTTFLELGFDSLFLSQVSQRLLTQFKLKITFRQLLGELSSVGALSARLADALPELPVAVPQPMRQPIAADAAPTISTMPLATASATDIESILREQLLAMSQLIGRQLDGLRGVSTAVALEAPPAASSHPASVPAASEVIVEETRPSRFQVNAPGKRSAADAAITRPQREHIARLSARYTARTPKSRQYAETYRPVLADPRAAAGFRSDWKDMVYPIVVARSAGSKLWDIDGNEYIDLVNGYGQTAFGHAPDFVVTAVKQQLDLGFAIGPQTPHAGKVAQLFSEITGNERVTFCNTGSEAVMAALRLARSVTGRNAVVVFSGAYHGQFDEVLVKGLKRADGSPRPAPVATGIPDSAVQNMVVLDYGTPASLKWIADHAEDLAAVVVEPVQSRHPDLLPLAFLQELRRITEASGTAFVMDEVVTGFRVHPGGMQAVTGIRADLATYGKVVGGGLPIGILAGKARFMDALDGGIWHYGDDSFPEIGVTFFAGTFVRHPLVMAATWAVLNHVKKHGVALQENLDSRARQLVQSLQAVFQKHGLVATIEHYSSLFYFNLHSEHPLAALLYYHLRERGIHIQDGFPCFLTTAHSDADLQVIVTAFDESLTALQSVGIFGQLPAAVAPIETPETAPLTESQIEIWLSAQLSDEASCAFNESVSLHISGALNAAHLEQAINTVVARHDSLRAVFSETGEAMRFAAASTLGIERLDLSRLDPDALQVQMKTLLDRDARTAFDLFTGPPVRFQLVQQSPTAHVLVMTAHHIICDGWSINLVLSEIERLYVSLCNQQPAALEASLSFGDYARQQLERDEARDESEAYWLQQFARPVATFNLPVDRPRSHLKSSNGATHRTTIDRDTTLAIKRAGAQQGCTLFVTLLAAFQGLMGRLAEQHEVVVGIPSAGQSLLDDPRLVGHCVNLLPIRAQWQDDTSLHAHLVATSRSVMDAFEHQSCTLGTIVRKLDLNRGTDRVPLTQVQFNLERMTGGTRWLDLEIDVTANAKAYVNFDLFMNIVEADDGLHIDCDYNTDLFNPGTMDRWLASYRLLLDAMVTDSSQRLTQVALHAVTPTGELHTDFNFTTTDYAHDSLIQHRFEAQVLATPDALAARFDNATLTYAGLDRRANRLAQHLRARINPQHNDQPLIGIAVPRSLDMLVALLATLKAGFAYLPLDPTHPASRHRHILINAGIAALITDGDLDLGPALALIPIIDLGSDASLIAEAADSVPVIDTTASDLAYVIYTSGSTGQPKGVEISHRSVVNLLDAMAHRPGMTKDDCLLAVTTVSFDIAVLELLLPLTVGTCVTIAATEDSVDGFALKRLIEQHGISVMQGTPSTWRLLLEAGFESHAGFRMLCGGEALPRPLANRLLAGGGELWNMYGPTETTIWSSCARIDHGDGLISIGHPIANTQFHIVDRSGQPMPVGIPGELLIGGDGVARGYHDNLALTEEKFVPNPFGPGRLYHTGDLAEWLTGGELQVLCRIDHQIKLRGFRIEPAEIESALIACAGLQSVVVMLREDIPGAPSLAAYYVDRDKQLLRTSAELRQIISQRLPDYMIPHSWVRLEALPLLPNGKLDRNALPRPAVEPADRASFVAAVTPREIALASIWAEVLSRETVGIQDDLFDLGADSIQIFQITARANRDGLQLSAKQLIRHRTISALAMFMEAQAINPPEPSQGPSLRQFKQAAAFDRVPTAL